MDYRNLTLYTCYIKESTLKRYNNVTTGILKDESF